MTNWKQMIKEINNGKNLEVNIPSYSDTLMSIYNQNAYLHLTMNYYMLYETLTDLQTEGVPYISEITEMLDTMNDTVQYVFMEAHEKIDSVTLDAVLEKIDQNRKQIIQKMKVLTTYTDKLQIYEYVFNRIELKYKESFEITDETDFVQKLLNFIFGVQDNLIINENIKSVLRELPIRMARTKYFQLVENSLSIYTGAEKSSVNRYLYMLETSAMLYEPQGMGEDFPKISAFITKLEGMDFGQLLEEDYHQICTELVEYAGEIFDISDLYIHMQEIFNSTYAYLLSMKTNAKNREKEMVACNEIIAGVHSLFENQKWEEIPLSIVEKLTRIEGKQEQLLEENIVLETVFFELLISYKEEIEKLNQVEKFSSLEKIQQLLSAAGTFVEFDEEGQDEIADQSYIQEVTEKLLKQLAEQFKRNQVCVNRAVMANTIHKFPVFFTSSEEIMEYIKNSLDQCHDIAEKQTSIEILEQMMKEEISFQ